MFSFFKKKDEEIIIAAPVKGRAISITEVSDPTFGECMLGKGIAILPEGDKVYSPVDGEISFLFDTLHAVSITSKEGVEILIHVGLDTVGLKGDGFKAHVATGDKVKKGDLLLTVDFKHIADVGLQTVTPIVVCNTDDYKDVQELCLGEVKELDSILRIVTN